MFVFYQLFKLLLGVNLVSRVGVLLEQILYG
jgi:hypothetical protein